MPPKLSATVLQILFNVIGSRKHSDNMTHYRSVKMEESGENPENSKAVTKSAASAARKVKAKQTRALDILKRDTCIVESTTPSRVGSFILIHTFEAKPIPFLRRWILFNHNLFWKLIL